MTVAHQSSFDVQKVRAEFPILQRTVHREKPLIFLDSAASSQHPQSVIDAMSDCYALQYSNVHRGIHALSEASTALYEEARTKVADFIGAERAHEVIFTSGTTMSINLVARAWGDANLKPSDEILLTTMEHHSNIVPWQQLAERTGATVRFVPMTEDGMLDLDSLDTLLGPSTRIFAFTAVSNVLGTINPVELLVERAHEFDAITVIDAAQHTPHEPLDVQAWNADFVAFSGHKMVGPSGVGILWGRESLLEAMPPFLGGGSMINTVTEDGFTPGELPAKFEAGTPPIVPAVGLTAAVDYLQSIGMEEVANHEQSLVRHAIERLERIDGLKVLGPAADQRCGIACFDVDGVSALDIAFSLDRHGVAVRAGHHCAMPLHRRLGLSASTRASFYLYNSIEEVDQFVDLLERELRLLRG